MEKACLGRAPVFATLLALVAMPCVAAEEPAPGGADPAAVPEWVRNISFKGDFRYRNETIDQQFVGRRNRDRIRVRAGLIARVNDDVRIELGVASSEGNDPRSSNVTLGGASSRKDINLDLAYFEWRPISALKLRGGKMKYPWERAASSTLFDGDINPEGLAAVWQRGDFFASAFHHFLDERANASESTLQGGQLGWKPSLGAGELKVAVGYFDFHRVRGRDPFHGGSANGNTTTGAGCEGGAASCLAFDYDLIGAFAEYSRPVAGRPLALFADFIANEAAANGDRTAWSAGLGYGEASTPRTWEVSYSFQRVDKDAMFGQFLDSDVGGGNTDHRAHVLRAGYAVAKNWIFNVTYQLAETDLDVPADIGGAPVHARNYERLQLDLNFRF